MLTDIGLNLASHRFDRDRDAVLARARAAGVQRFILTGTQRGRQYHRLPIES